MTTATNQERDEAMREMLATLTACAKILPRYRLAGKTVSDDEELSMVLDRVEEAIEQATDIYAKSPTNQEHGEG
jgi:hypothetical protein